MSDGSSTGSARAAPERRPSDYTGAIYGSLLAASVVAGTSPGRKPAPPAELIVLLLATGIVFWLAHVYAQLGGDRLAGAFLSLNEVRVAAAREWPIAQAAVPPALAAGIGAGLGLSDSGAAWLALLVAVAGQLGWALYAAARAGATRRIMIASGAVNLVLGLLIVLLKAALSH
jgi:hypothetical protein